MAIKGVCMLLILMGAARGVVTPGCFRRGICNCLILNGLTFSVGTGDSQVYGKAGFARGIQRHRVRTSMKDDRGASLRHGEGAVPRKSMGTKRKVTGRFFCGEGGCT